MSKRTKLSRSTLRRIERATRKGWQPGMSVRAGENGEHRRNRRANYNSATEDFNREGTDE